MFINELLQLKFEQYKAQRKSQCCNRCQLSYAEDLEQCPYCSHLDEEGLAVLLKQKERNYLKRSYLARRELGIWFLLFCSIIAASLLLIR